MNIKCSFCQTPFTLSRVAMLDALQEMDAHKLTHYDAHCPRCRRATPIQRQKIEMFMPKWRDELKKFEAEMKENPQQEAPLPKPEAVAVAEATPAPEPKVEKPAPKAAKKEPAAKAKPAAKATTAKAKAAPAKKTTAKKSK
ncbi:MAG: hypothetical protein QM730_07025 [Anaerolineales bacterium]